MSVNINFIESSYPADIKLSRAGLLSDLLRFSLQGVQVSDCETGQALAEGAGNDLKSQLFDRMVERPLFGLVESPIGDTVILLSNALKSAMEQNGINAITAPCLPEHLREKVCGEGVPALRELICPAGDYAPSVLGAYQCAKDNLLLCESQIVCLQAMVNLLRDNRRYDTTPASFSELRSQLFKRREQFMLDVLLFGALVGEGREAAILVTERLLYLEGELDFSIMQFLQLFGRFPGSWATADEDDFRADIARRYKALASPEVAGDLPAGRE